MEDKEVGEHWRWCQEEEPQDGEDMLVDCMRGLIRKLVEERADCAALDAVASQAKLRPRQHYVDLALRDFGIDPVSYGKTQTK